MKTQVLLNQNYVKNVVLNWSKKEALYLDLTKLEKLSILEATLGIPKGEFLEFNELCDFAKLTQAEQLNLLKEANRKGQIVDMEKAFTRTIRKSYDKASLSARVKYHESKEAAAEIISGNYPIGLERIKAFYLFFNSFSTLNQLVLYIKEAAVEAAAKAYVAALRTAAAAKAANTSNKAIKEAEAAVKEAKAAKDLAIDNYLKAYTAAATEEATTKAVEAAEAAVEAEEAKNVAVLTLLQTEEAVKAEATKEAKEAAKEALTKEVEAAEAATAAAKAATAAAAEAEEVKAAVAKEVEALKLKYLKEEAEAKVAAAALNSKEEAEAAAEAAALAAEEEEAVAEATEEEEEEEAVKE